LAARNGSGNLPAMNACFDTLDYANAMVAAGIQRSHAEAIAKGLADLVANDIVTREFAALRSEIKSEFAALRAEVAFELAVFKSELRDEIRKEIGRLELQIRPFNLAGQSQRLLSVPWCCLARLI
jgi:hypothetical protein